MINNIIIDNNNNNNWIANDSDKIDENIQTLPDEMIVEIFKNLYLLIYLHVLK